jgi:UDP-N-acetyl-alpha-D-muramoyl-L-alanyl-L-glutamate epimerase
LDITRASGAEEPIIIKRVIDPKLLELNNQGYLNGHTPFSAYLAFLSTLAATLYDYKNIVVSNESSSNEGNIEYLGKVVNHQYSKTFEFEQKFRDYAEKYLAPIKYFSFLRPLSELQIAKLFSHLEKYHTLFRSCNVGSSTNSWCGRCAKCLFAYIILRPYLGEKIDQMFGKNLLDDESLKPLLSQLLREDDSAKPFDCVGLVDETKAALFMIDPTKYADFKDASVRMQSHWDGDNNLSEGLEEFLRSKLNEA